ncbi:hypothetical protein [Paenibacillus thermotolerans]|uniref:hypothetical protein n=1 Tax=Paenibacillus thermotolerans TaxID=3027807 RepID=UPI0023674B6B|nr:MULTISPECIES: hypothetical protein [unclassified Paenibacillus]
MSAYLTVTEAADYAPPGVTLTNSLIIRASAIIDAYCKREISVKSYTERIPLNEYGKGHVSFYPVVAVSEVKARPKHGWTGDNFFGPPSFESVDVNAVDTDKQIGFVTVGSSTFGAPYTELEVTYSSGWDPIPDKVRVACGLIIAKLANNFNPNVKAKKDFDFSIEYFGPKIVTDEIGDLLSEYVHRPMR